MSRGGWLAVVLVAAACGSGPRGPCRPDPPPGVIGSLCGFANPEDVEAVPSAGLLLVSEMRAGPDAPPGSLTALALDASGRPRGEPRRLWPVAGRADRAARRGDPTCGSPPRADRFAPHGITAGAARGDGSLPLAVVHHGTRESVELFDLVGAGDAAALRWRGCVPLPPDAWGNDVVLAGDGLYVTDFQPAIAFPRGAWHALRGGLGLATGALLAWEPGAGWRELPESAGPQPNGLALARDGRTLFVAYTGRGRVLALPVARGGAADASPIGRFEIGGYPDNLAHGTADAILALRHDGGLAILLCRLGRRPCRSPWSLVALDPASGAVRELFRHDGSAVGGVSSVAAFAGRLFFGAIADDRLGVLDPAFATTASADTPRR